MPPSESVQAAFILVLNSLEEWLNNLDAPHLTIGGIAVSLIAQPRATQDIDLMVWLDHQEWERLVETGESYGFTPRVSNPLEFARSTRVLLFRHIASGITIDISLGALPFEKEMIDRAQKIKIGELSINVPTPEDLIITKVVANRAKDIVDIEAIIKTHPKLDEQRIRRWSREFAEALEMPELLVSVERLLQSRHRPKKLSKAKSKDRSQRKKKRPG